MTGTGADALLAATWSLLARLPAASSDRELAFLLVNDSLALAPYRQAALWLAGEGAYCLSGVVQIEANAPYVQWLDQVAAHLHDAATPAGAFSAADLPPALAADWAAWWPAHGLWLPAAVGEATDPPVAASRAVTTPATPPTAATETGAPSPGGAALFLREAPWSEVEAQALSAWVAAWAPAFQACHRPARHGARAWGGRLGRFFRPRGRVPLWRQTRWWVLIGLSAVLSFPVRLSVLAPAELVPARPVVVRAPLDGVIDQFHVLPNQQVTKGQPLFGFDEGLIRSRLEIGRQALATAEIDYRQNLQLALSDARAKGQLALLTGKIEERRAEVALAADQLNRARVLAPEDGVVLMDDPSEWMGRPVSVGERILRIASPTDREVEAWLPLADAIALEPGAPVTLYLQASPLAPVAARLRYMGHDAQARPDGQFAYRIRATLEGGTAHRIGLKGTAKLQAGWVPLGYWMLRRPWAALRTLVGM